MKNGYFDGEAGLQISVNSTDEGEREGIAEELEARGMPRAAQKVRTVEL
jgi:hypothetical protein